MKTALEIGKMLIDGPTRPMTRQETEIFVSISLREAHKLGIPEELKATFPYKVGERRAEVCGVGVSEYVLALICCLSKSPAEIVMFIAACAYILDKWECETVNMDVLSLAFPVGFPIEESFREAWDVQKLTSYERVEGINDNSLDAAAAWPNRKEQHNVDPLP